MNKTPYFDTQETDCVCDAVVENSATSIVYIAAITLVSVALLMPLAFLAS